MGELAAKSLMHQGAARILFCNRTQARAEALAERFRCAHAGTAQAAAAVSQTVSWDALHRHASEGVIVVTCTGAGEPVFIPAHARGYASRRRQRPMFFIDIAVPRDVDPEVNRIEGIFVYNIDDLQAVASGNLAGREKEAQNAEAIIAAEVERYSRWLRGATAKTSIVSLTRSLEQMRKQELERAAPRLSGLSPAQMEAVEQMTRGLVNKLQHGPIQALKRAARDGDLDALMMIDQLFAPENSAVLDAMPFENEGEGA
jgi:glutamyl-tRNA reductase